MNGHWQGPSLTVAIVGDLVARSDSTSLLGVGADVVIVEYCDDARPWCHLYCRDVDVSARIMSVDGKASMVLKQPEGSVRVLLIEESCATVVNRLRRAGAINSQPAQSLVHEDAPVILVVGVASLIGLIQQDALPADRFIDLIRREKLLMIVEEPIDSVINSIGVIRPDLTELMRLLVSLGMVIDIALSLPSDWMRPLNGWLNLHGLTPPRATERVRFEEIASLVHEANPNRMIVFAAAGMTVTRYQMSLID